MSFFINGYAILNIIVIFGISQLLKLIDPSFSNFDHPNYWLICMVITGLSEANGMRARISKIPMWVLAILGYIITTKSYYEETGSLVGIALLMILIVTGYYLFAFMNKLQWSKAKESLKNIKEKSKKGIEFNFLFDSLENAFYVPPYLKPENIFQNYLFGRIYNIKYKKWFSLPEINSHYLEFFDYLKKYVTEDEYKRYVAVVYSIIKEMPNRKDFLLDQAMCLNIYSLIEKKKKEISDLKEKVKNKLVR